MRSRRATPAGVANPLRPARLEIGDAELDGLQLRFGASVEVPFDVFATGQPEAAGDYAYSAIVEGGPLAGAGGRAGQQLPPFRRRRADASW